MSMVNDLTEAEEKSLTPSSKQTSTPDGYSSSDLTVEEWREYEWGQLNSRLTYRITNPVMLVTRPGGTTHRVVDGNGVTHCLPAPGQLGCVLRWKSKDPSKPVEF